MNLSQFKSFGSVTCDQPGIISMGFWKHEILAFGNLLLVASS